MILATHAIVGAAAASFFPEKSLLAFSVAFTSHFLLDAIPHWDYRLRSEAEDHTFGSKITFDKDLLVDGLKVGSDLLVGFLTLIIIFNNSQPIYIIILGALGGVFPDPLQFVHNAWFKREPLTTIQRFHIWIHDKKRPFREKPILGISLQAILVAGIILITKIFVY